MLIKSINWIITDVCNLRCRHCDIWRLPKNMADAALVEKLLADEVVEKSYAHYGEKFDISIGGGEPFAHPRLQEIVNQIHRRYPGAIKSFSTNGVLTKRIIRFLKENSELTFKLNMSIDGIESTHDRVRGVAGAFKKTVRTIRAVRRLFPAQRIEIKMAIMRDNFSEINDVYRLSQSLGCSFSCKPVDEMENYTNRNAPAPTGFSEEEVLSIRNQAFALADEMLRKREYKKARFTKDIPFHLTGKRRHTSCSVLWEHITVMVNGDIFFCIKEEKAGNIFEKQLREMSTKPKDFKCKSCMLMCGSFKDYDDAPYAETVANFEATLRCNLTCPMCTQKELQNPGTTMTFKDFCRIINEHDICHVSFIGGESFMNKEIFLMMGLLDSKGISYELTTNGTLFTDLNKAALRNCIGLKKINFSLDGLEQYHDRERGRGTFRKALKAMVFASRFFNVSIASIIKSDNLSGLVALRKFLNTRFAGPHKFIYAMNLSEVSVRASLQRIPELNIQGPRCTEQVKNEVDLTAFFLEVERLSPQASFEPRVMRTRTSEFLGDQPLGECKQLQQLRFEPGGKRITCEFIRNQYDANLAGRVNDARLPICAHCCKMDIKPVVRTWADENGRAHAGGYFLKNENNLTKTVNK